MNPGQVRVECGCLLIIEPFERGERRVFCPGGGVLPPNGHGIGHVERCKGGRPYKVTAEQVNAVRYAVEPLKARAS